MNVYLRHANDSEARLLATVNSPEELDDLISDMEERGVYANGDTYREIESQYMVGRNGAHVELVVGD